VTRRRRGRELALRVLFEIEGTDKDADWALQWARANGEHFDFRALQDLPAFRADIRAAIDRTNQDLSVVEKIRQFAFTDEPFSIENEEMTPVFKYEARMRGIGQDELCAHAQRPGVDAVASGPLASS